MEPEGQLLIKSDLRLVNNKRKKGSQIMNIKLYEYLRLQIKIVIFLSYFDSFMTFMI